MEAFPEAWSPLLGLGVGGSRAGSWSPRPVLPIESQEVKEGLGRQTLRASSGRQPRPSRGRAVGKSRPECVICTTSEKGNSPVSSRLGSCVQSWGLTEHLQHGSCPRAEMKDPDRHYNNFNPVWKVPWKGHLGRNQDSWSPLNSHWWCRQEVWESGSLHSLRTCSKQSSCPLCPVVVWADTPAQSHGRHLGPSLPCF